MWWKRKIRTRNSGAVNVRWDIIYSKPESGKQKESLSRPQTVYSVKFSLTGRVPDYSMIITLTPCLVSVAFGSTWRLGLSSEALPTMASELSPRALRHPSRKVPQPPESQVTPPPSVPISLFQPFSSVWPSFHARPLPLLFHSPSPDVQFSRAVFIFLINPHRHRVHITESVVFFTYIITT